MSKYKKRFFFLDLCQLHGKLNAINAEMLKSFIQASQHLVLKAKRDAQSIRHRRLVLNAVQKAEGLP